MEEIKALLATPLDTDNGHILRGQLGVIESWGVYASMEYRKAAEALADLRGIVYDPSLKTELERKVNMERQTRQQQRNADEWADVAKLIRDRVSLGQSFLKSMQAEIEGNLR